MDRKSLALIAGICAMVVTVLAGLYWNRQTVPVNDEVPGTFAIACVGLAVAILLGTVVRLPVAKIAAIVGSSCAAGAILDAMIHFIVPPESANLFPLAALALGVVGAIAGLIGGLIGKGVMLLKGPAK